MAKKKRTVAAYYVKTQGVEVGPFRSRSAAVEEAKAIEASGDTEVKIREAKVSPDEFDFASKAGKGKGSKSKSKSKDDDDDSRFFEADDDDEDEEDDEDEDDDDDDGDDSRSDTPGRIQPRRSDEFLCQSCFILKPRAQLAEGETDLCVDCV